MVKETIRRTRERRADRGRQNIGRGRKGERGLRGNEKNRLAGEDQEGKGERGAERTRSD